MSEANGLKDQPTETYMREQLLLLQRERIAECEAKLRETLDWLAERGCGVQTVQVWTNGVPGNLTFRVVPVPER